MPNEFESDPFSGPEAGELTFDIPSGEAQGSKYEPPGGEWVGTVLDIDKGKSKNGNDQFTLSFSLDVDGKTYELRQYLTLTQAAMWRVTDTFRALGVPEGKKKKSDIIGKRCICVVHRGPSEYHNGELRSNITKCKSLDAVGPGQLPGDPNDGMVF